MHICKNLYDLCTNLKLQDMQSPCIECGETAPSPMADKEDRNEENVGGKFYVDSQCIDCDLCRETAPNNFTRADDEGYSFVFKQPENSEEEAQCREAMEGCPVEAIGEDGE
jgi:ferredoxin